MLLAALLAMLVLAAMPVVAQVTQEGEQEAESGDLSQESSTTQEGDNSIQCVNDQLTGNTGNAQTLNQGLAYASESASPSGNAEITLTPNEDVEEVFTCDAQVNQAASASG
jgi:Ca2+-binding RTX toxin-like protein